MIYYLFFFFFIWQFLIFSVLEYFYLEQRKFSNRKFSLTTSLRWKNPVTDARCPSFREKLPSGSGNGDPRPTQRSAFLLLYANATGWRQRVPRLTNAGWPCAIDRANPETPSSWLSLVRARVSRCKCNNYVAKKMRRGSALFFSQKLNRQMQPERRDVPRWTSRDVEKCVYFDRTVSTACTFVHSFVKSSSCPASLFFRSQNRAKSPSNAVLNVLRDVFAQIRF